MIYSLAENFCSSNGYTLPRANYLNHSSSRGIGSLYSEWGDMGHYTTLKLVFNQICIGHLVPQTQTNNT